MREPRRAKYPSRSGAAQFGKPLRAAESLSFPAWFPPPLEDTARRLYVEAIESGSLEEALLVERLVCDSRMKAIWTQLTKRRGDGQFLYGFTDCPEQQFAAIAFVFKQAILIGGLLLPSFANGQMQPAYYAERIMPLANDAQLLRQFARRTALVKSLIRSLLKAADAYEQLQDLATNGVFDVQRFNQNKMVAINFVTNIARIMRSHFGHRMYGVVATMASVALERKITTVTVREWCSRGKFKQ